MTAEFDEALARWETGELSRDELARRFPEEDVTDVLGMFERMQAAATGPTPDPATAWEALRGQLPVRLAHRRKRSRGIRLLAAAMVALLALGATAYAFVPGVRRAVSAAFDPPISAGEGSPGRTVETGDQIEPIDPTGEGPDPDDAVPDDDDEKASPATDPDEDAESQDQGEDQTGNDQGQDEDEGTGSEQGSGDDGTTQSDQGQETQGAGSQEGSDDTAQDVVDQGGNDANQPDQPGDENSGD